jgi:hypothetical protein
MYPDCRHHLDDPRQGIPQGKIAFFPRMTDGLVGGGFLQGAAGNFSKRQSLAIPGWNPVRSYFHEPGPSRWDD